ncbi:hypothetical protein AVEN_65333-1 [Araneus ventricosus]|uniref:Uncharacterized protein n=1 Tax=Araneus ventricosus TaxID=182803 RepID=A0A4Y2AHN4_ARAVE|nr:hypothetical protein AVEN_65333-1 [Araneus ventricosus]
MECISDRFAVLEHSNMIETSETELLKFVQILVENYNELSSYGILTEIPRLRRFLKAARVPKEESLDWTSLRFFEFVVNMNFSALSQSHFSIKIILNVMCFCCIM